jgi:hypothetical protein
VSEERMVTAIRPECRECRRERAGRARSGIDRGWKGERPGGERCPHLPTIWAPGFGPDSEPPPGSGWDTRPQPPV